MPEDADLLLAGCFWPLLILKVGSKAGDVGTQLMWRQKPPSWLKTPAA